MGDEVFAFRGSQKRSANHCDVMTGSEIDDQMENAGWSGGGSLERYSDRRRAVHQAEWYWFSTGDWLVSRQEGDKPAMIVNAQGLRCKDRDTQENVDGKSSGLTGVRQINSDARKAGQVFWPETEIADADRVHRAGPAAPPHLQMSVPA